tara:strand:- start:365 stop:790 length:426 start_codon:yes stop_codon:yes gene_type:complete
LLYKIIGEIDHLGYRHDGNGRVLYIFNGNVDYSATEEVIKKVYTENSDGEIDYSEYDPSFIETGKFIIEDEKFLDDILQVKSKNEQIYFFENMLDNGVYLIFVDVTKYTIEQIQRDTIKELVNCNQNLILFAREYDPIEDY